MSLRLCLAASASAFALLPVAAMAQETPSDAAIASDAANVDSAVADSGTVIVTGTRRANRTISDSTVPIDVLTTDAIQNNGFTETNRILNQLVPSFNFPQPSITDGTDVVRPATLRGLSPDQTLVLVNGKRRHTTALLNINGSVGRGAAAVDINLIPSIALSRVEVLRDGAAAQYGSDAIAGVINFQLSRETGARITATYGQYESRVDGIEAFTGLQTNAAGQPVLTPDANRNGNGDVFATNTTGKDRKVSDGETLTVAATVGVPVFGEGNLNVSFEYQDRNPTNRTGYDPRRQYNRLASGAVDPREFTINRLSHRYGDAATKDLKLFVNTSAPLGENAELYAFGSYGYREGTSGAFVRLANDARNVAAIYPDGFLPLINTDLDDISGVIGIKGEIGDGFRYDLSANTARNAFDFLISNTLNRSYGTLPGQKTAFDAGGLRYTQTVANLDLSKDITVGFAKSLTLAAGGEYRRETYQLKAGEPSSYNAGPVVGTPSGAQGFPGIAPLIGGQRVDQLNARHNWSAYVEADLDVTDAFSVQAAGRYEDYSDFGSDWNGKLAARLEPVEGFALRGAISTGFRAPSLQQQFFAASATNNVNGVLLETVTLPVNNPIAVALGSQPLDPETSVSYSAGVVITAVPRLNVTVDVYQVSIDDRIVVTDNLTANRAAGATNPGVSIARILDQAGFTATNAARFFVNGVDTRTRGIDAVATYRMELFDGRLNATAGFNYNKTKLERILAAPGPLANIPGLVLFGRQEQLRLTQGQPRTKINLSLDYERGPFGITARTNRFGRVLAAGADQFGDVRLGAKWVSDLEVRADVGQHLELAVGANNLFDVYPDRVPVGLGTDPVTGAARAYSATNYVAPWSNFSPFGFNGRFLYARVTAKF
ncbi:TonB-dependent receptor plug domain-containing protein [Sphingomonas jatrophae]|uniref:Iron complex outermembrane recepter protein n=1 Tax=Sphingomonas jatrophae TaxID=1166337 RepID=A0A1I6JXI7_9SPHN|nr:TonB-dependent receptor [Sphingomonas jatrophae]SFR83689.1 iron complex outermembrane recepter protein [Sphingomonas jatrophae]